MNWSVALSLACFGAPGGEAVRQGASYVSAHAHADLVEPASAPTPASLPFYGASWTP